MTTSTLAGAETTAAGLAEAETTTCFGAAYAGAEAAIIFLIGAATTIGFSTLTFSIFLWAETIGVTTYAATITFWA